MMMTIRTVWTMFVAFWTTLFFSLAAIIGASRPEQVTENVKASGVKLETEAMKRIDDILDGVIESDPSKTVSPPKRDFNR